ncbi:hypothetical protein S40288_10789, partial [Stachybotrys chartarum IBT 40288]
MQRSVATYSSFSKSNLAIADISSDILSRRMNGCYIVAASDSRQWRQSLQHSLGITARVLDNFDQGLEARVARVAQTLIHPALTRRDHDARLRPQPIQRNHHLGPVAATHAISYNVDAVPRVPQIERRLGDADVRLDADEGDVTGVGQGEGDGRDGHGEARLVVGRRGQQGRQAGDGGAELGGGLGGAVDGYREALGEVEELRGSCDAGR